MIHNNESPSMLDPTVDRVVDVLHDDAAAGAKWTFTVLIPKETFYSIQAAHNCTIPCAG